MNSNSPRGIRALVSTSTGSTWDIAAQIPYIIKFYLGADFNNAFVWRKLNGIANLVADDSLIISIDIPNGTFVSEPF